MKPSAERPGAAGAAAAREGGRAPRAQRPARRGAEEEGRGAEREAAVCSGPGRSRVPGPAVSALQREALGLAWRRGAGRAAQVGAVGRRGMPRRVGVLGAEGRHQWRAGQGGAGGPAPPPGLVVVPSGQGPSEPTEAQSAVHAPSFAHVHAARGGAPRSSRSPARSARSRGCSGPRLRGPSPAPDGATRSTHLPVIVPGRGVAALVHASRRQGALGGGRQGLSLCAVASSRELSLQCTAVLCGRPCGAHVQVNLTCE